MSGSSKRNNEDREQEYTSKIKELMNNHKVGGAKSAKIMKLILKQRFRKAGQFINKWDLLWLATQLNLPDLVEKLMGVALVDINKQFGQRKYSCLHLAASYGYRPIIQLLLQNNADFEVQNSHAKTALQIAVDDLTRKFLKKEIEKKRNLYSKYRRLETDFSSLDEERKDLEKQKQELFQKHEEIVEELKKAREIIAEKDKEINRMDDYTRKLKERGLQDQTMLEEFESNILTSSSVLTAGEKLEIGLQMMKKMVSRNRKLQEQLRKTETELSQKQKVIIDCQRDSRKLKEKVTLIDSRYCKDLRKKDFVLMKLKKKMIELSQKEEETTNRIEKMEQRNKLYVKSQRESIGVIAELERGLKNTQGQVKKKEEKIQKLYEIIQGMNVKNEGVQTNLKRLQDEMKRQEKDDLLGRSPHKKKIIKQKQELKKMTRQIDGIEGEKKLTVTKLNKLETVLQNKQNQINILLKRVDEKTVLGTKKTIGFKKLLEKSNQKIESLMLTNQKLENEKKKMLRERETERTRQSMLLKKEKRINLRWEKMLLKMDKEKKIFDERARTEEERSKSTFEERRMQRRRKKLALIGTDKGKSKVFKDKMEKQEAKRNERSVAFIRKKVSRVFDENEDLKHLIKKKDEEMEVIQERLSMLEAQLQHNDKKYEEDVNALKTEIKEKELKIEKLLIKIDRGQKRKRMKHQREKDIELKKEKDDVDRLLYKSNRFLTKNNITPKRKRKGRVGGLRRKRKF